VYVRDAARRTTTRAAWKGEAGEAHDHIHELREKEVIVSLRNGHRRQVRYCESDSSGASPCPTSLVDYENNMHMSCVHVRPSRRGLDFPAVDWVVSTYRQTE